MPYAESARHPTPRLGSRRRHRRRCAAREAAPSSNDEEARGRGVSELVETPRQDRLARGGGFTDRCWR